MATVTVILGLCGSGKSEYLRKMTGVKKFEEGVRPDKPENLKRFLDTLALGKDCAIIEIGYITQDGRDELVRLINSRYPDTILKWVCFENDLAAANWNCCNDPNRTKEEAAGHIRLNQQWTGLYTIPNDAVVLKIFRVPPLNR